MSKVELQSVMIRFLIATVSIRLNKAGQSTLHVPPLHHRLFVCTSISFSYPSDLHLPPLPFVDFCVEARGSTFRFVAGKDLLRILLLYLFSITQPLQTVDKKNKLPPEHRTRVNLVHCKSFIVLAPASLSITLSLALDTCIKTDSARGLLLQHSINL